MSKIEEDKGEEDISLFLKKNWKKLSRRFD